MTLVATTVLQSTDRTFPKSLTRQCCTNGNDHFTGQVELHILKKKKLCRFKVHSYLVSHRKVGFGFPGSALHYPFGRLSIHSVLI